MILSPPLKNIHPSKPLAPTPGDVWISQKFANVWIADRDLNLSGHLVKKGDNVYKKIFGWEGHNGVDITAPRGTPIYATHNGYIVEARQSPEGYGIRVCLVYEDDGKEWLQVYGHLNDHDPLPVVPYNYNNKNYPVKRGQLIGHVDSTGSSTGDHLHWGLYEYKNGIKLNNDNGYGGGIDPWPFVKDKFMEFFQIEAEQTLVLKNLDGGFLVIATTPEFYEILASKFGLEGKNFPMISKAEVEAGKVGEIQAGFSIV